MRIGFDAKRVFHNFRGLGNYSRTLIESLVKYYPEQEYMLYTPPIKDPRSYEWQKRFNNLNIRTPRSRFGSSLSSLWRSFLLSGELKRDSLDLYHGLSHELPMGIDKLPLKRVVTVHDLIFMRFPEFFPWIDRRVYFQKLTYAVCNADLVVAICEQTKKDLIEFLNVPEEKIRVVYQSCSPAFYLKSSDEERELIKEKFKLPEHYLLYVGAIEERKNVLALVKAFARLKDLIPHQLVLVGRGKEYKKKVEREVAEQGMLDRVLLLDNVSNEELPPLYQMASLFVFPSFFEGWGIPNVEALFSEVPVITSLGSCFAESAGPHSLYCDPHSIEDMAHQIERALFDDRLRESMRVQGRAYAEKFHWKKTSAHLMDIYSSLF